MTALIMLRVCINVLGSTVCVSRIVAKKKKKKRHNLCWSWYGSKE